MTNTMQALIARLERIEIALEAANRPAVVEGFRNPGPIVYCNVSAGQKKDWYTVVENDEFITQPEIFWGGALSALASRL